VTTPHSAAVAAIAGREDRLIMDTYRRQPVELVRGDGFLLFDRDGNEYLDFVAGIAVNVVGHGNPRVAEAIARQARELVHVSDLYYTRPQVDLAQRLNELGFTGRAFFANSGAEANEAAIKIARKWGKANRAGAYEVLSTDGSFHGRTLAAVAATGQPKYQAPFAPMPDGFRQVPYNDIAALQAAVGPNTAAILLEPIQGESGVIPAAPGYLRAVRDLCDAENLLLVLDEVQTGVGRTGTFYAFQDEGVVPDVVTLAKGLGGGVPIGVCLAGPRADVLGPGDHGSTFGGQPLACAAALATLDVIAEGGLVDRAREIGDYLQAQVASRLAAFGQARGRGLLQALVLAEPLAVEVTAAALGRGLMVNSIGDRVVRMVPPLIIGRAEVDRALDILEACLDELVTHVRTTGATA
jgi:acetylornithine/N-succinyldiaminopimelate aminotransferase